VSNVQSASLANEKLISAGAECVVLTLGAQGAVFQLGVNEKSVRVTAPAVDHVVDTTGWQNDPLSRV
jgi:fructose-1-phosphate kinase PfkB-like protein